MATISGAHGQDAQHPAGRDGLGSTELHGGGCGRHARRAATLGQEPAHEADDALMAFVDGDALLAFSRRLELLGSGARA